LKKTTTIYSISLNHLLLLGPTRGIPQAATYAVGGLNLNETTIAPRALGDVKDVFQAIECRKFEKLNYY